MNFKNIPEYDWSVGYQYGLLLVALSAIVPIIWFKWRGWWQMRKGVSARGWP